MKIGVVGDSHGNTKFLTNVLNHMGDLKVQHVIVVGDFGLWTHVAEGHEFLDDVNNSAAGNRLTVYAVGGNHENWDHWNWLTANMPTSKGAAFVRRRILLFPKVNYWKWDNKRFLVVGGAVSVDKEWRLMKENEQAKKNIYSGNGVKSGAHTLWWPDEQLSDEELATVRNEKVDYLFTHDCSDRTPFWGRLKPDLDSMAHRKKIDKVLSLARPEMHFHGHMHNKYVWDNDFIYHAPDGDEYHRTVTRGLECDGMWDSWGVLDTDTNEFLYRGERPYTGQEDDENDGPFYLPQGGVTIDDDF